MDSRAVGVIVIAGGILLVGVGILIWSGAFSWFGRLPGDLRFEGERTRIYAPLGSMLLLSVLLSLLLAILRRFL